MTFTERLTEADLKDVEKMIGRRKYSFRVFLYGPVLVVLFSLGYIRESNWTMVVTLVVVYCVCLLYSLFSRQQAFSKRLAKVNELRPDRVNLTTDGLQAEGPHGATSFLPWETFKSWREGKRVILLERNEGRQIHILPVGPLSETDRLPIRQFLQSHISRTSGR
jgi:hypothetical protein